MERNIISFTPLNNSLISLKGPIISALLMRKNALNSIFTTYILKNLENFTRSYHQRLPQN